MQMRQGKEGQGEEARSVEARRSWKRSGVQKATGNVKEARNGRSIERGQMGAGRRARIGVKSQKVAG